MCIKQRKHSFYYLASFAFLIILAHKPFNPNFFLSQKKESIAKILSMSSMCSCSEKLEIRPQLYEAKVAYLGRC